MVVEWGRWWCSCGVMLMVRCDGDDQEKKKKQIFRVCDYDMMKIVQWWWWWCRDDGADMVMIIYYLTISSWDGPHTWSIWYVLDEYQLPTTHQQINLFAISNIMVMLDIGDGYDEMAILISWSLMLCLMFIVMIHNTMTTLWQCLMMMVMIL